MSGGTVWCGGRGRGVVQWVGVSLCVYSGNVEQAHTDGREASLAEHVGPSAFFSFSLYNHVAPEGSKATWRAGLFSRRPGTIIKAT